jgi:hypothetical protein
MFNPFERRATEYLRDDEAFLAVVTPEPIRVYLAKYGAERSLYDRLVVIRGTPGSGKTTIARVFETSVVNTVLRHEEAHKPLMAALDECGALQDARPVLLAARIPLESDYREIWELPYPEDTKNALLTTLLQCRTVLAWKRQIDKLGVSYDNVHLSPDIGSPGARAAAGADSFKNLAQTAGRIEEGVLKIIGALVPPPVTELAALDADYYRPFETVGSVEIHFDGQAAWFLHPLLICDDANTLHPQQLAFLQRWLIRRELKVGRWLLTRLDALRPEEAFALVHQEEKSTELPGVTVSREVVQISLQSERKDQKTSFRKMARDMANRYMRQMPMFATRKLDDFSSLLSDKPARLSSSKLETLRAKTLSEAKRLHISNDRYETIFRLIADYSKNLEDDEQLALLLILLNRYATRVDQKELFGAEDPEPARPLKIDSGVEEAARLYLLHTYQRSFFFGFNDLCDASSENAEQFLRLSAILVDAIATRLIRNQGAMLSCEQQTTLLRERAEDFIKSWNFPYYDKVRMVVQAIATRSLSESLRSTAWLGSGANAFGIPQEEFETITSKQVELANVLKYGMAYNAFTLVPNYDCQGKRWCLIELGGIPCLSFGLTLKRGGFIKSSLAELVEATT